MSTEQDEVALACKTCDWITFPMRVDEARQVGWFEFTNEDGETLARDASVVHVALRHPSKFAESSEVHVEEFLAAYERTVSPLWFKVARAMALFGRDRWDHEEATG
jgi:hypothetical protein